MLQAFTLWWKYEKLIIINDENMLKKIRERNVEKSGKTVKNLDFLFL